MDSHPVFFVFHIPCVGHVKFKKIGSGIVFNSPVTFETAAEWVTKSEIGMAK